MVERQMEKAAYKKVPAVERATRILDIVARAKTHPTLTEIGRELGLAKSSAHTLCRTLCELNLLIRRPDQSYQLGPHLMRWSHAFLRQSDVATEFASIWDRETGMPGATITLSVLEGEDVVYLAARNSDVSHGLIDFRAGQRLPAAFTATGKAFLAHLSDAEVRRLYPDGLPPARTRRSVATLGDLLDELRLIRSDGYSVDDQQVADGLVCFGAAVLDSANRPIAGVAVSLLAEDVDAARRAQAIDTIRDVATRLSARMGAEIAR